MQALRLTLAVDAGSRYAARSLTRRILNFPWIFAAQRWYSLLPDLSPLASAAQIRSLHSQ